MPVDDARLALLMASLAGPPWIGELFGRQRRVLRSGARRKAIRCSRRAGKTVTAASALAEALEEADFDEAVVYAARTRGIAKRLIWAKLRKIQREHRPAWVVSETELTVTNERGGFILVVGLDKPAEIEKLRGLKMRRFIGDEPATYSSLLEDLYDEILEPACADLDGDVWLMGTPGPILSGFWHDVSRDRRADEEPAEWELHHWTMFDNPHMKDPVGFLERVMKRKGWSKDNPTVLREYYGLWVSDEDAQVYRYLSTRNDVASVPGYNLETRSQWAHAIGVDFGMTDSCAWVVIASHKSSQDVYALRVFKRTDLRTEQAADVTRSLVNEFDPFVLVGDGGGLGKPYVAEYNARHFAGIKMLSADKTEKRAHIELMNSDIRVGRFKLLMPECKELAQEWTDLPWANDKREREHPAYPNHASDAALYAWRHHRAFMHRPPEKPKAKARPDSDEYIEREEREFARQKTKSEDWWEA